MSSKHLRMVPFTNSLGITMMIMETEVDVPSVAASEYVPPIDHTRWVYAVGSFATALAGLLLPFLF